MSNPLRIDCARYLDLSGSVNRSSNEFKLPGIVPGQPHLRIAIAGRKLRNLAWLLLDSRVVECEDVVY